MRTPADLRSSDRQNTRECQKKPSVKGPSVVQKCTLVALCTLPLLIESARLLPALIFAMFVEERVIWWLRFEVAVLALRVGMFTASIRLWVRILIVPVALPSWLLVLVCVVLILLCRLLTCPTVIVIWWKGCSFVLVDSVGEITMGLLVTIRILWIGGGGWQ
jgi:hypothetical protein